MSREQITLRGEDAERFRNVRSAIGEARGGFEPSNSETARMMMCSFSVDGIHDEEVGY